MRRLLVAVASVFAACSVLASYLLWGSGVLVTVERAFEGDCERITGVAGAEDIAIDREIGMAYLSSRVEPTMGIYAYDLTAARPRPQAILPPGFEETQTFGISLWEGHPKRLFVIDRAQPQPGVEIFDFETPTRLRHVRSVRDPLIRYPNDLAAVGRDEFYLSNTHAGAPGSFERLLETFLRTRTGDVVRVAGDAVLLAAANIAYPNGVNVSVDGGHVIVASTSTAELHLFARAGDGTLTLSRSVPMPGLADNIDVLPDGRLVVGLHPKAIDAARHLSDASLPAPTRIVMVSLGESDADDAVEILYDDPGDEISAGAIGAIWRDRLLIGPVSAPYFLDCRMAATRSTPSFPTGH